MFVPTSDTKAAATCVESSADIRAVAVVVVCAACAFVAL